MKRTFVVLVLALIGMMILSSCAGKMVILRYDQIPKDGLILENRGLKKVAIVDSSGAITGSIDSRTQEVVFYQKRPDGSVVQAAVVPLNKNSRDYYLGNFWGGGELPDRVLRSQRTQ